MTMPKKEEVISKAKEIWFNDQFKAGLTNPNNPTENELKECGCYSQAVSELMTSEKRKYAETDFVDFAQEFSVDLRQLYEANALILGSRHTGKSDVAMMISQKAMKQKAVVVVFDPSLDWITRSSIKQYLKVETSLEIPSESVIYDLSLCSPLQAQKIVEDFSEKLFQAQAQAINRRQYVLVFEESHTYFFQGVMRAKRMQSCVKLLSVGRNLDIACVLISQFPSMLDKFCVKHAMSQSWFGFSREPNDLRYLRMILGETSEQLPKLNDGEFLYLTRSGLSKIQIEPYKSNTPKTQIKIPELKPISEKPKETTNNNTQALVSFLGIFMWFLAIVLVLSH